MKKLLVSVLAIAGLVACNQEQTLVQQGPAPMEFGVASLDNATRVDPSFTTDRENPLEAFDVWAWMDNENGNVLVDEDVTKENGAWGYTNLQYWMPGHNYTFHAVARMNSNNWTYNLNDPDNGEDNTIDFTNVDGTEDLIFATATQSTVGKDVNADYAPVQLVFNHLLSKTKFTFKNGFATDNVTVQVKNVKMTAFAESTYNVNVVDPKWDDVTGDTAFAYGETNVMAMGESCEATDERLVIPASADKTYTITYDIYVWQGANLALKVLDKTSEIKDLAFVQGKAYNFTATISPETLDLDEIEFQIIVNEWDTSADNTNTDIKEAELRAALQLGGVVEVSESIELSEPLTVTENSTINMADGVTLKGSINVAEGVKLTVNGGAIVNEDKETSGIVSNGDLTLNDVEITSARHALRIESGNVVINGGEYKVDPISKSTLHALNVGDNNTVANVIINGGKFIGPKGTQADSGSAVKVRAGSTVVINGGDFSLGKNKTLSNDGTLTIYGGTFDQDPSAYVAAGFYSSKVDNVYYVADHKIVSTAADLQTAMDTAVEDVTILFVKDIDGDVKNTQKPGVVITIDGAGYEFAGVIVVDGKSGTYTTAGLTIKNVNFVADAISADACVRLGDGTDATRYTCNVTLDNCTFDVAGAVGVKSYTGGDKNLTITNCTATAKAHSLVQAKGIDGILVKDCTISSKNGMNFNNSTNVVVDNCTTDVKGYAARFGESSGGTGAAEVYTIKNSTLKSACEDGDSVIILRGTADYSTLTIENTTIEGERSIANNATGAKVIVDGNEVTAIASSSAELKSAIVNGATIALTEGTYSLPSLSGKEGVVIIGTEGTVIGGDNASTGYGANFGKNTTIKNVTFSGTTNGVRWSYAQGGEAVFENCTFAGGSTYGFHIDQSNGATFTFNDCVFSGFNAFAGDLVSVTFNDCTFEHNGNYGHTNIWSVAYFNNCTWGAGTSVSGTKLYFNGVEESYLHEF